MNLKDVANLSAQERFLYWIQERESIRLKKESGKPKPWTDDEILQKYKFCNVRRMDDRVSQWLLKNWYEPYLDHPNMLVACTIARFFNLPTSLELITGAVFGYWNPKTIRSTLRRYKSKGNTIFNNAYMVRGNDGVDKVACVMNYSVVPIYKKPPAVDTDSLQETYNNLYPLRGMGIFMAAQITADMRWAVSGEWKDRYMWAAMGPGSKRGMNRLHGRDKNEGMNQEKFERELGAVISLCIRKLPHVITDRLEAIDYQNCLCEYDKYCRTLAGEGRPKSRYPGEGV